MEVTPEQLISLIGSKEVEITMYRSRLAEVAILIQQKDKEIEELKKEKTEQVEL